MIPLRHAPETLRFASSSFRRRGVVPPRHHVPCSSFDAHARVRLTATTHANRLSTAPIHDRGALLPTEPLSFDECPTREELLRFTCPRPSCDDSVHVRRSEDHLSMITEAARGRRFAGCWRSLSNAHPHMPHGDFTSMDIFRRPCPRSPHDARLLGAHRCACVRRTSWMLTSARNRWRQVPRPAPQLALFPGAHGTFRCSLPPPPGHRSPHRSFDRRFLRHSCPSPPCCPFGQPFIEEPRLVNRSASLDAHDSPALPCSRSRSFSRVLRDDLVRTHCLRFVTAATTPRFFHARPHTCLFRPCGPNEHTHCARSYSAYCHRESLARSSRSEPPCSSFRAFRPDLRVYGIASVFA
jgi:hypothetical protein